MPHNATSGVLSCAFCVRSDCCILVGLALYYDLILPCLVWTKQSFVPECYCCWLVTVPSKGGDCNGMSPAHVLGMKIRTRRRRGGHHKEHHDHNLVPSNTSAVSPLFALVQERCCSLKVTRSDDPVSQSFLLLGPVRYCKRHLPYLSAVAYFWRNFRPVRA